MRGQWRDLVEGYLRERRQLRGVIVIVDVRRGVEEDDAMLLEFLKAERVPALLVATKIDKLGRGDRARTLNNLAVRPLPAVRALVGLSSVSGEGVPQLWGEIDGLVRG